MVFRERLADRVRTRQFSTQRAGSWSRAQARRKRLDFCKRGWRWLALETVILLAAGAVDLLVPRWCRQFVAGGWLVGVGWLIWYQIVVESGSTMPEMGAQAEEWTARELRSLVEQGWRVMSHLVLRSADIDHVAIGAGGTVIVETKWRSDEHAFGNKLEWLDFSRLRKAAHDVELMLRARLGGSPTYRVVVLWGPVARDEKALGSAPDDVVVVPGARFGEWLGSLPDSGVTRELIADAWKTLEEHVRSRDAWDLERDGPDSRSVTSWLFESVIAVVTGVVGFLTAAYALRFAHVPWFWVVASALLAAGAVARRWNRLRLSALAWLTGVGGFVVLLAAAYAYELLRKVS